MLIVPAALLALCAVFWLVASRDGAAVEKGDDRSAAPQVAKVGSIGEKKSAGKHTDAKQAKHPSTSVAASQAMSAAVAEAEADEPKAPVSEEEKREAEEEALVEAFDALTDSWMEPSQKGIAMDDVQRFVGQFRKLPASRKGECLQRALNLVPDENVMLLAGVLMDKSQENEYLEMVYNDVLNRDEDVKKPILQQIFKDKDHPCWADTAWILDVTGELPGKKLAK